MTSQWTSIYLISLWKCTVRLETKLYPLKAVTYETLFGQHLQAGYNYALP